jgi:ABC-2 type transport system permease protein
MATATELWSYRTLITNLTERELKAKYKRSVLGWLWSLINPLATLAIYSLVFGTFLKITPPGPAGNGTLDAFPIYLFTGLVIWNLFAQILTGSLGALSSNGDLLKKVYFPPECPAIANVLAVLAQTFIESLILMAVYVLFGNFSWTFLLWPILILMVVAFSLGVGLVLSLMNVYFRDVEYLISIMMQMLFYFTPIIYSFELVKDIPVGPFTAGQLLTLNPLTQYVGAARDLLWDLEVPTLGRCVGIVVVSLGTLLVGWVIFTHFSRDVSEEL